MVPTASLVCMGAAALAVVLVVVGRRRWRFSARSCVVGALVFVVFALVLESAAHAAVFSTLPALQRSAALYALYGALAAGVFEELGRVRGFALLRRIDRGPDGTGRALGAGAGHAACLECGTCLAMAPKGVLKWHYPRGSFGIMFREG